MIEYQSIADFLQSSSLDKLTLARYQSMGMFVASGTPGGEVGLDRRWSDVWDQHYYWMQWGLEKTDALIFTTKQVFGPYYFQQFETCQLLFGN
jgi:hypothetical protein